MVFILLLFAVSAPQLHASDVSVRDDDGLCSDGSSDHSGKNIAGKPINLLTGTESLYRTDLTVGNFYPITIQRRFNSGSVYDSNLGYGWSLNYDKRLYRYPDGSATVRKDCGQKLRYVWNGSGFISSSEDSGSLVRNADDTYTYTDTNGSREFYDAFGRLTSLADNAGNSLVLTYEADWRFGLTGLSIFSNQTAPFIVSYDYRIHKIEEKDASGALTGVWVTFSYDTTTGRLIGIWDSTGRAVNYDHDVWGNLSGVRWGTESVIYGYGDQYSVHHLVSINEGQGPYANEYDAMGRVKKQIHGTGTLAIEYLIPNQKVKLTTTVADQNSNVLNTQVRIVEFDGSGMVVKNTDTFGHVTNYIRDSQSSKIAREEYWENTGTFELPNMALKTATDYTYDVTGNMLTKTEAQGTLQEKTTTYTYDPVLSLVTSETVTSVVDPAAQKITTNVYYPNGKLQYLIEDGFLGDGTPYTYTTTNDYYTNGKLKSIDGPRTDVQDITNYAYDPTTGFLTTITQPLVGMTTYSNFDPLGNPQTVTDPNGNATTYTYDTTGRVLTVRSPGDTNPTQYVYVSGGCTSCGGGGNKIDHITLPEGNTITYTYDALGNIASIKDSLNNSINYTYDSEGNKLSEEIKDASGVLQKTLGYQYTALNRLSQVKNPDGSYAEYGYDFRGNRTSAKDPKNNSTTYSYDALNRLTSVVQPGMVTAGYGYDTNNNLTTVTDANGNATTYKYDDKGRVYQVISPDTGTTTYSYDSAGDMVSKKDAKGVTITYVYDASNRLTKIDFPTDTDIVYTYDACLNGKGRLCNMTDSSGTTSYEYTPKGQVKKEMKLIDSVNYVTQYTYDQNGNMKTMTYPSGKVITYNYTNDKAISVLNGAANIATSIAYKPFGGMSSITFGNSLAGTISYDNQYRVTGITSTGVMNLNYPTYDNNGNIQTIQDLLSPAKNRSFTYDSLDRLGTATGTWGSLGWTYDGVGNRQTENGSTYIYAPNTNKLASANGISFNYDNNGNTTTEAARVNTYNQNQRLIQVTDGAMTAGNIYNGNGQRVKKNVNGTVTIFHYGLNGQIIAESNSAGTIIAEYVYLNSQPLTKMEGTNTYYYHNDHLATPQKMTDSTGAVVWSADYKPFGEATITVSTITNNLRFPGQYYDVETTFIYNYFRNYNPSIARYVEADPIGIRNGRNHLYVYVKNNPVKNTDSTGLHMDCLHGPCKFHSSCIDNHEHPNGDAEEGKCFNFDPDPKLGCNWPALNGCIGNECSDIDQLAACKAVCECPLPQCKVACTACLVGKGIQIGICFYENCKWKD
ncbi:MAG: RHS repeat-associated core domain-containing protein [Nitrospirota bacterium]